MAIHIVTQCDEICIVICATETHFPILTEKSSSSIFAGRSVKYAEGTMLKMYGTFRTITDLSVASVSRSTVNTLNGSVY